MYHPGVQREGDNDERAGETSPGVRMLKQVWGIRGKKDERPRDPVPQVGSDIYNVPVRSNEVPRRRHGRST